MDALQAGLSLFQESGDLIRLQSERLALETRCEQHRSGDSEAKRQQDGRRKTRQVRQKLLANRVFEVPDRDQTDHVSLVEDRGFASRGHAKRSLLHPHPGVSGKDSRGVFVHRLSDHRRVWM